MEFGTRFQDEQDSEASGYGSGFTRASDCDPMLVRNEQEIHRMQCMGERMPEDVQLQRLMDYTIFHIGVYVTLGTGLITALAFTAKKPHALFFLCLLLASL